MRKTLAVAAVVMGIVLCGMVLTRQGSATGGQQTPAANSQKSAAGASSSGTATKSASGNAAASAQATGSKSGTTPELVTKKNKQSYAIGANFGRGLKQQPLDLDPNLVAQGVKDALAGGKLALTDEEARGVLTDLQSELQKNQEAKMSQLGDANKKEGAAFLAANKSKEGVVALPSGLQYKIMKAGTGPKPTASDTVVCNYRGTLINGKEFDSSYKRGQPASFPVSGVIRGWTEALQLMPVGSTWQLFVPSDLAYGDRGAGPDIGPGATLIFDVELISIQGKK
jgi:FKBP-type peptidyl-prolyl cis-trans isomerase FklB